MVIEALVAPTGFEPEKQIDAKSVETLGEAVSHLKLHVNRVNRTGKFRVGLPLDG